MVGMAQHKDETEINKHLILNTNNYQLIQYKMYLHDEADHLYSWKASEGND